MQPEINRTFITLVPKRMQPIIPQDFRPISLCNVIYKIIAKSLADRLKPHLPDFIDPAQAAFNRNRHISSNIIIIKGNYTLLLSQILATPGLPPKN